MTDDCDPGKAVESNYGDETGFESIEKAPTDRDTPNTNSSGEKPNLTTDVDVDGRTYIERRQTNKDERESLTIYIAGERRADLDILKAKARRAFPGEKLTDLDLYEAVFVAGIENEDEVIRVLESLGYGR